MRRIWHLLFSIVIVCSSLFIYTHQKPLVSNQHHVNRHRSTKIPSYQKSRLDFLLDKGSILPILKKAILSTNEENISSKTIDNNEEKRQESQFDDYNENPGPMFG